MIYDEINVLRNPLQDSGEYSTSIWNPCNDTKKRFRAKVFYDGKKGEKTCLKHANVDYKPIRLNDN